MSGRPFSPLGGQHKECVSVLLSTYSQLLFLHLPVQLTASSTSGSYYPFSSCLALIEPLGYYSYGIKLLICTLSSLSAYALLFSCYSFIYGRLKTFPSFPSLEIIGFCTFTLFFKISILVELVYLFKIQRHIKLSLISWKPALLKHKIRYISVRFSSISYLEFQHNATSFPHGVWHFQTIN